MDDRFLLESDNRLKPTIALVENNPDLLELLGRLTKLTGVTFTLDKNLQDHRPLMMGRPGMKSIPASAVLGLIAGAQLTEGRWIKNGDGYLLTAKESTAAQAQAAKKASDEAMAKSRAEYEVLKKRFPHRFDPKLQAKLTIEGKAPSFPDLLAKLQSTIGINLAIAENLTYHDPNLGVLHLPDTPVYSFMEFLTLPHFLENGRWVKIDGGYRLEGISKALKTPPAAPPFPWLRVVGGTATGVFIIGLGLLWWRGRKAGKGTAA